MTIEEQLAAILAKLEERGALLHILSPTESPLHPSSSVPVDVDDDGEVGVCTDSKPATPSSSSSASSASPPSKSSGMTSGVAPVTTEEHEGTISTNDKLTAMSPAALMSSPASAMASSTSSPQDGVPATLAVTMSALVVFTDQDDSGKPATRNMTMATSSASPNSTSSGETSSNILILTPELPQASPTRCSTSGPSHDVHVSVPVAASAPSPNVLVTIVPVSSSPTLTLAPSIPAAVESLVPASSPTLANGDYNNLSAKSSRYLTVTIPNSSQAPILLVGVTTKYEVHVMFELLPEQNLDVVWPFSFMHYAAFLPPDYNTSDVFNHDAMQPPAWPPPMQFEIHSVGVHVRPISWPSLRDCAAAVYLHPLWSSLCDVQCLILWPPPALVQLPSNCLVQPSTACAVFRFSEDVPEHLKIPWPSFNFRCYQDKLQSSQPGFIAFDMLLKQQGTYTMVFNSCIIKVGMLAVIFNYCWPPPELSQCLSVILLIMSPWPSPKRGKNMSVKGLKRLIMMGIGVNCNYHKYNGDCIGNARNFHTFTIQEQPNSMFMVNPFSCLMNRFWVRVCLHSACELQHVPIARNNCCHINELVIWPTIMAVFFRNWFKLLSIRVFILSSEPCSSENSKSGENKLLLRPWFINCNQLDTFVQEKLTWPSPKYCGVCFCGKHSSQLWCSSRRGPSCLS